MHFFRRLLAVTLFSTLSLAASGRAHAEGECAPSRVMVVLDRSSSMQTGKIGGVSKWQIAVEAMQTVTTQFASSLEIGLNVFPDPNQCSPGVTKVQPGLATSAAIMSELQTPPPSAGNWTPMAQTLSAVAREPSLTAPGAPAYAVLVTDGWQWCDPYDAATRFSPVDAISELSAAGITTYVVGFGGAVDALALNNMAVEAGTARPGCDPSGNRAGLGTACYYSAGSPAELVAALTDIAVNVSAEICDGLDNDCDGEVDEDLVRECASACGAGAETCVDGAWAGCDAPPVETDVCDGADNDCDGTIDPGCDCAAGETRDCGGDVSTGACQPGTQTCAADGSWGECVGAVNPQTEVCDGIDNDCDGSSDEVDDDVGNLCGPGSVCTSAGSCEELPPEQPPGDDDDPTAGADDAGTPAGGCGCSASSTSEGAGGNLLLFLLGAVILRARRRRRM